MKQAARNKQHKGQGSGKPKATMASTAMTSPYPMMAATPGVGRYSVPSFFFIILAILAYLGPAELGYHHGLFSAGVYEPYLDLRSIPRAAGDVNRVDSGRELYASRGCAACHQPNGSGNPANGCPPLAKADWVLEEGPGRLIRLVLNGAQGPMTVNGQTWNGVMPPWKDVLSDEEIANILSYVRASPEWGNNAAEVTPEQVAAVREKTASRSTPWTPDELMKISTTE
jgi:mono/diheme cytochrome c family protein